MDEEYAQIGFLGGSEKNWSECQCKKNFHEAMDYWYVTIRVDNPDPYNRNRFVDSSEKIVDGSNYHHQT